MSMNGVCLFGEVVVGWSGLWAQRSSNDCLLYLTQGTDHIDRYWGFFVIKTKNSEYILVGTSKMWKVLVFDRLMSDETIYAFFFGE